MAMCMRSTSSTFEVIGMARDLIGVILTAIAVILAVPFIFALVAISKVSEYMSEV